MGRKPKPFGRKKGKQWRPKNKPPKSIGSRFGDMTMREASDYVGAAIKGGVELARRIWNVEEKMFDTTFAGTVITSTGSIQSLTLIPQGVNYNERTGQTVGANNLRLAISAVANATAVTNFLRVIVLIDTENAGATITTAGLFQSTAADIYLSPYLNTTYERYKVILDEHVWLTSGQVAMNKRYVFPLDFDVMYSTAAGSLAAGRENAIFVVLVSDNATNGPTVAFDARLNFVDN